MSSIRFLSLFATASLFTSTSGVASAQGCVPAPPGLVSWWSADGHSDDLISDNDGGAAVYAPGVTSSVLDRSFSFDGFGTDRVDVPGTNGLEPIDAFTVAAWLKVGSLPFQYMTAYDRLGGNGGFGLSVRGNGHVWFTVNGGLGQAEGATDISDGQWHHVVGSYNRFSGQMRLFVDGGLEALTSYSDPVDYGPFTRHGVGGSADLTGSTSPFHGDVDEIMVFDRALSTNEAVLLGAVPTCAPCGTTLCVGVPNSTGLPGALCAVGSPVVLTNELTLVASDLPLQSTVLFVVSQQAGFTPNPGGSIGNLCLGGAIGRFLGPGQVTDSGSTGMAFLALDLLGVPSPTGPVVAVPGDTFHFQAWHRDIVGGAATSNFSSGLSVTLR